jgi:hypothetical protein
MAGIRGRVRRAQQEARAEGVVLEFRDGSRKVFADMYVRFEMFLCKMDLFSGESKPSEVLSAVREATPESRAKFEAEYGPIEMEARVIAADYQGGWVEIYCLTESGEVEKTRHEGHTEEAERLREEARRSPPGF